MQTYFSKAALLKTPGKRAAFSDRTAYLMAEMARLAYFKFEGGNNVVEVLESVKEYLPDNTKLKAIEGILKSVLVPTSPEDGKKVLSEILEPHGFELIETFFTSGEADKGAEAFLCRHKTEKYAILAFRGTEASLKDIKADISASLTEVDIRGVKVEIHSGYYNQFISLQAAIQVGLKDKRIKDYQLFITGHSLGGALAITATKFLASDITGACYTFGSPPVGTAEFARDISTPIYRIINHVDIVPNLPNPTTVWVVRMIARLILLGLDLLGFLRSLRESKSFKKARLWLQNAQKYRQSGYGSYLVGEGSAVQLRYTVGTFDKVSWWWKQVKAARSGEFKMLTQHSIDEYSGKLGSWAAYRQSQKLTVLPAAKKVAKK